MKFRDLHTGRLFGQGLYDLAALVRARTPRLLQWCGDPWGDVLRMEDDSIADLFGCVAASVCRVLIVTRHPERAREWYDRHGSRDLKLGAVRAFAPEAIGQNNCMSALPVRAQALLKGLLDAAPPNLILATQVRTQAEADARIPALLDCPAALRAVRVVPSEAVDLRRLTLVQAVPPYGPGVWLDALTGHVAGPDDMGPKLGWLLVAAATDGPATDVAHVRDLVAQARATAVPVWVERRGVMAVPFGEGVARCAPPLWPVDVLQVRELPEALR